MENINCKRGSAAAVEKIGPFEDVGWLTISRWRLVSTLECRWVLMIRLVFTYENADAPRRDWAVHLRDVFWLNTQVTTDTDLTVAVGSGKVATALVVDAPNELSVDTGEPVMITVTLQDEDGNDVPAETDLDVGLASSNSDTGSFMVDGEAVEMVTITAGMNSAMVSYTDSAAGTTATITASADDLEGMDDIMVTSDEVEITSATFSNR